MTNYRAETDLGNAERLCDRHGGALRYVEDRDEWRAWNGTHWASRDVGPVYRCAAETARSIREEADELSDVPAVKANGKEGPSPRERRLAHALQSESRPRQQAMIDLAAHQPPISCIASAFDVDPWLLNTPTGLVDLRDGGIRTSTPADMQTRCTAAHHDPIAPASNWAQFVADITCGDQDLEGYLQRAVGLSLIGTQREHVFFFCFGGGANGKGTFLNAVCHALGNYGVTLPPDLLIERKHAEHPTELADLEGARFVVGSEVPKSAAWNEVRLKMLSGGDRIKARRMRTDFFEFEASHTFWVSGNDRPRIRGTDSGIWRRVRLIPFRANFPVEKQDRDLADKLRAESAGILWWALEGCRAYLATGLGTCDLVKAATDSYRESEDIFGAFLADHCAYEADALTTKTDFRRALTQWLENGGFHSMTDRAIAAEMTTRGFEEIRAGKDRTRFWQGVRLVSEPDAPKAAGRQHWQESPGDH